MPKAKERAYPTPGKTPENTPAPRRATDRELREAFETVHLEIVRLTTTSLDMNDKVAAGGLAWEFARVMNRMRSLRDDRAGDMRYFRFEQE